MSELYQLPQPIDKTTRPRVLITTDLEVDDMNGILLTLLYATDYDLTGIVWTAGMYHFNGDGEHTLEQITPHYRCEGTTAGGTVEHAGQLREYRPVDPNWLRRVIDVSYRRDYEWLKQNNPNYPTPDFLLSITKTGNVAFESDYRFETEGSQLIVDRLLDDDMRPLYIMHWGGFNTTARALISIYEKYHDTADWEAVQQRVVAKVRFVGSGEDYCREDSGVDQMFPGLQDSDWRGFGGYGQFFSAAGENSPGFPIPGTNQVRKMGAPKELLHFYKGPWLCDAIKFGHGQLMSQFHLFDDGQPIYGEPYCCQYGLITWMDWSELARQGFGAAYLSSFPRVEFERFDWMCCQFPTVMYLDMGLRQGVRNQDNHYTAVLFEELAARADWTIAGPAQCNHAPVITAEQLDFTARAGESVTLRASASDPDGDALRMHWWIPQNACCCEAEAVLQAQENALTAQLLVPAAAQPGDRIVVNFEVQDVAERPMTRFAQFFIDVVA